MYNFKRRLDQLSHYVSTYILENVSISLKSSGESLMSIKLISPCIRKGPCLTLRVFAAAIFWQISGRPAIFDKFLNIREFWQFLEFPRISRKKWAFFTQILKKSANFYLKVDDIKYWYKSIFFCCQHVRIKATFSLSLLYFFSSSLRSRYSLDFTNQYFLSLLSMKKDLK